MKELELGGTTANAAATSSADASTPSTGAADEKGGNSGRNRTAKSGGTSTCWICLDEEGPNGEPLLRNCSCRGADAGYAHVVCITQYAKSKSVAAYSNLTNAIAKGAGLDPTDVLHKYRTFWTRCPNCDQYYEGRMSLEIAEEFVQNTSSFHETDFRRILAQMTLACVYFRSQQCDVARPIFRALLRIVQSETNLGLHGSLNRMVYPFLEHEICMTLSELEATCGRYADAHDVLTTYLGRASNIFGPMLDMMRSKADYYKSMASGQSDTKSAVEAARKELEIAKGGGEDRIFTLQCTKDLVKALTEDGQNDEAIRLGKDLVQRAERVLGKDHESTSAFRSVLQNSMWQVQLRDSLQPGMYFANSTITGFTQSPQLNNRNGFVVKVTREGKYVILIESADYGPMLKYKVLPSNLIFWPETKVVYARVCSRCRTGHLELYFHTTKRNQDTRLNWVLVDEQRKL